MLLGLARHLLDDRAQHAWQLRRVHIGLADTQGLGGQPVVTVVGFGEAFMHQGQQKSARCAGRKACLPGRLGHCQAWLLGVEQLHERQAFL
ncbi:hypothetical protein D3C73_1319930 [compost metagenome]